MALSVGADAIVVSNHGGRQLDGAMSSIRMLPSIMDAVGDQIEVHLDSGIRSGQDVLKALAWGRRAPTSGGPLSMVWARWGRPGVTKALEVIHKELDVTMALCGEISGRPARSIRKNRRRSMSMTARGSTTALAATPRATRSFVKETENVGFMEAVEILAREAGMPMPARDPQAAQVADRRSRLAEVVEAAVQHYRLMLRGAAGRWRATIWRGGG
jgi:hypothetical protein